MKKFFRNNGLSITILLLFFGSLAGQMIAGFKNCNEEIREYHGKPFTFGEYLTSGHFFEATFENWESEFLQMGIYILLTVFLYQRGSAESKDPDEKEEVDEEPEAKKNSPKPVTKGGLRLLLYQNSLSIAFFLLFAISFILHFLRQFVQLQ